MFLPSLRPSRRHCAVVGLVVATACGQTSEGPASPVVIAAAGRAVPENVTSARVVFSTRPGDSVRVSYWADDQSMHSTPYRLARSSVDTIIVLGLRSSASYEYRVEARRNAVERASAAGNFATRRIPDVLAEAQLERLGGRNPSDMAMTVIWRDHAYFGVVFDTAGSVVWYHDFSRYDKPVTNLAKQPNGNYTAFMGESYGWQPNAGYYVELTPGGREVAQYHPPAGHYMDPHELLLTGDGPTKRAHFFTYTIRPRDLRSIGGKRAVQTAGHQIIRMTPSGAVEFMWDAWDHIAIGEWISDDSDKSTRVLTDYDHPNALTFDNDGKYVVSWRNLSQVMAIDPDDGAVLWRIGGTKGNYRFLDDPLRGFSKQHAVKILPNGDLLLFDNGTDHSPSESRAVQYELDHARKTARMVWQYRHPEPLFAAFVGWVERLKNGDTWIAFALLGRVVQADPNGKAVWEAQVRTPRASLQTYRITPVASLR
jgi:hypothetical protein